MKTTIDVKGYQIVIDESEEQVSVTATKDDETVEEFTLDLTEEGEGESEGQSQGEDGSEIKSFGEFGGQEEEDFDDESGEEGEGEETEEGESEEIEEPQSKPEKEEGALESFSAFTSKRK